MKPLDDAVKTEVIRLRTEQRLGIKAISAAVGVSTGSVSLILRPYPLSGDEVKEKSNAALEKARSVLKITRPRYSPDLSVAARAVNPEGLSKAVKGRTAEAAILYRLAARGFEVWRSCFEGSRVDWLVTRPGLTRYSRVQVRWAKRGRFGRPLLCVRRGQGREKFTAVDCDVIVGYDMETDVAFVFKIADVSSSHSVTCHPANAEAWHLLGLG